MSASAEARQATTALLTIRCDSHVWAIPSAAVAEVEPFDTDESAAVDVLALLGAAPSDAREAARVLVLRVAGQQLRLLARGELTLKEISSANLQPLPAALLQSSPLISHVVLNDGKPTLFVVSPERLLRALGADARSASPPLATLPENHSC
ncbi:MAG TPA: hypothetical protein VEQ58_21885 [Polyangiaceae bacterium]|nr:hypothetical protein [Polyangiaceae bacterium]